MGFDVYYSGEIAVSPNVKREDQTVLREIIDSLGTTFRTAEAKFISKQISDEFKPSYDFPMALNDEGDALLALDREERPGLTDWLAGLIKFFFQPRGYALEGDVRYSCDECKDFGTVFLYGAEMEDVADIDENEGPSWAPTPYIGPLVRQAIQDVLDSGSYSEGGNLIICAKGALDRLATLIAPKNTSL